MTDEPEACPYLGIPDDPRTRFTFATTAHRCHVGRRPSAIDLGHQGAYCLSGDYAACNRYRAPAVAIHPATPPLEPAVAVVASAVVDEPATPTPAEPVAEPTATPVPPPVLPAPKPVAVRTTPVADARSRLPTSAPTASVAIAPVATSSVVRQGSGPSDAPVIVGTKRSNVRRVVVLALVAAIVLVAAMVLIGAIAVGALGPMGSAPAQPTAAAVVADSPSADRSASLRLVPSPSPSASPTAESSPSPSPTPAPTPTASRAPRPTIHVVKPGENLSIIAAQYGVTPQALARANRIKDPNVIHVGQKLIIPPRR